MIARVFHAWERRLAAVDTNRYVQPFGWGLDWIGLPPSDDPLAALLAWAGDTVAHSTEFYAAPSLTSFEFRDGVLRFPSAVLTPVPVNNIAVGRVFEADRTRDRGPKRAVVVLPQWNADASGHVGLCQLLARLGLTAVRLSLPYHDERRPPELARSDYIVSANLGQTLQTNRQAVIDTRQIVDWLTQQGYERIGILGTSLGSCLAMLTMAHEPRLVAGAFNHISPYFADVVWQGISTHHVRAGLEGHIALADLRACWMPISPQPFIERVRGRRVLLVYAHYNLTFPLDLSRQFIDAFKSLEVAHETAALRCGHYTTGKAPFKFVDGYVLSRFLRRAL